MQLNHQLRLPGWHAPLKLRCIAGHRMGNQLLSLPTEIQVSLYF